VNRQHLSFALLAYLLFAENFVMAQSQPSDTQIRQSYIEHGARTQLHRWYQYYESPYAELDNQLDLLSEDISVSSAAGKVDSRAAYAEVVQQLPDSWQNSHELQKSEVNVKEDGTIQLTAEIAYLNTGMLPDGALRANTVNYDASLRVTENALPIFDRIDITTGESIDVEKFSDLYPENRLRSLAHYWMALVEHPQRNAEPFREILAPNIDIDFGRGSIRSYEGLAEWIATVASSVEASRHRIENFSFSEVSEHQYEVQMELGWHGIRPDGVTMSAKTHHVWTVIDDASERFARVETIRVNVLEPFAVVED